MDPHEVDLEDVLTQLKGLQSRQDISIVRLSEPIKSSASQDIRQRNSDASNSSLDGPTPASLAADLAHYAELFAKLRFSYVEQVSKEKFIRAIVGDPPLIVTMQENLDLEKENAAAKSQLKALKTEVADMVLELEKQGRSLSQRYDSIQLETAQMEELPAKSKALASQIEEFKSTHDFPGNDPALNLPLRKTQEYVMQRKREQQELTRELEALRSKVPRKQKEADRLRLELGPLEAKRQNSISAARDAVKRKEDALGGVADDLEQRARWWRASESALTEMLDIKP